MSLAATLSPSASAESFAPPQRNTGPVMQISATKSDIALAKQALQTLHAGYDRHIERSELDHQWAALEAKAQQGMSRETLYVELSLILASIRCDHTKAELPKDMAKSRNTGRSYLPFRFVLFGDRMFIDTPAEDSGLSRGDEVTAIDGISVSQWLQRIRPLVPVDGYADHVKNSVIAYGTEFMGGALDHFAPLISDLSSTVSLEVLSADQPRQLQLDRLNYDDFLSLTGDKRYASNFADAIRYQSIGRDVAYLAIDTFVNYRKPVDAMATLSPIFERVANEGRKTLILDLRANGGGSDDAQAALLRHLIQQPIQPVSAIWTRFNQIPTDIRPYLWTWDAAALSPHPAWLRPLNNGYYRLDLPGSEASSVLNPADQAFTGQLLVLTGPNNSSGSTHLLAALRTAGIGTFVGERTGGSPTGATAGILYYLTLPESGIRIRIPATRTVMANAEALPKQNGLEPDVGVTVDADSYFAGQDPVLQAAMRIAVDRR